ncbi:hypothetical protein COLO4_29263 [Corchorus olitorius]|uniref:Uncharacterized protein n=1 Tax=Corchorus olitorius TaxID=93759 RepID=A0A1R3HFK0_9ROSI|nr:hypothetical protein COLO4_29263 [Corchorus olitorius]
METMLEARKRAETETETEPRPTRPPKICLPPNPKL